MIDNGDRNRLFPDGSAKTYPSAARSPYVVPFDTFAAQVFAGNALVVHGGHGRSIALVIEEYFRFVRRMLELARYPDRKETILYILKIYIQVKRVQRCFPVDDEVLSVDGKMINGRFA